MPQEYICLDNFISGMSYDMYLYDRQDWGIMVKAPSETRLNARIYTVNNQYYSLKT